MPATVSIVEHSNNHGEGDRVRAGFPIHPSTVVVTRVHMSGDPDAALTLEEEAAECSSRVSERGLGSACERGDAEEVKFLLHAGVDPDTRFEVSTRRC